MKSFRRRYHGDDASRRFMPCMRIRYLLHALVALVGLLPFSLSSQKDGVIIKNSLAKGCLHKKLPQHKLPLRVCNSEDNLDHAINQGICRIPEFDYLEIRIKCQVRIRVCVCVCACVGKERNEWKRVF